MILQKLQQLIHCALVNIMWLIVNILDRLKEKQSSSQLTSSTGKSGLQLSRVTKASEDPAMSGMISVLHAGRPCCWQVGQSACLTAMHASQVL